MQQQERSGYNGFQVLVAFLGGAAAGAVAALLSAPRSGREMREAIRARYEGAKERVVKVPHALRDASGAAREAFAERYKEETTSGH